MLKNSSKNKVNCQIQLIPHNIILPNPHQPRTRFNYAELEGLACSIRANGLLQPINVRQLQDGKYELISGERRLRAARMVGLINIPCVVMNVSDEQSALFAIIENVQRENLDFFEEAVAIEKLMVEHGLSQQEISKKLGISQTRLTPATKSKKPPKKVVFLLSNIFYLSFYPLNIFRISFIFLIILSNNFSLYSTKVNSSFFSSKDSVFICLFSKTSIL